MRARTLTILGICLLTIAAGAIAARPGPATATGPVAVDAGFIHTCAVTAAGGLKCWGENGEGQLGNGSLESSTLPVDVVDLGDGVAGAAAGSFHSCALTTAGEVLCWGWPGHLGDGTGNSSTTPVAVIDLGDGVSAISSLFWHTCAVTLGGGVKCWGHNSDGQLGAECGLFTKCAAPVQVEGLESGVVAVAAGFTHTCALTMTGRVKCWGSNSYGELGDGTTADSSVPVDVLDENGEPLTSVAAISASIFQTCVLTTLGGMKCWGLNYSGQLGDGTSGLDNFSTTPVDVLGLETGVVGIAAGGFHSCALMAAGGVKCWGDNMFGQLGGTSTELCPIVNGSGGPDVPCSTTPIDVEGFTEGGDALTAGSAHTCLTLSAGGMRCWGDNSWGQLGDGTTESSLMPVDVLFPDDDSDDDGCTDAQEQGSDVALGGLRNPKSFWDFFDVWTGAPFGRDRAVNIGDIGAIVARFGASREPAPTVDEALTEALTPPPDASSYHAAFDRGGSAAGGSAWDLLPPDGGISVADIGAVIAQFGHSCA